MGVPANSMQALETLVKNVFSAVRSAGFDKPWANAVPSIASPCGQEKAVTYSSERVASLMVF